MTGAIPMNRSCGVLLLFYVLTSAAQAADPRGCVAIDDDAKRLACYDTAFDRAPAPPRVAAPAPAAAAATVPSPSPDDEFGMNDRLREEKQGEAEKESPPERIQATVTAATRNVQGYYSLALDNGQRWTTTETAPAYSFKEGDVVSIKRASFGSFLLMRANGGRALRARRAE